MPALTDETTLLSRDDARERCFARDGHACVFCGEPAVDAHHIVERRLFPDGGYYLGNLISVCEEHHLACERTTISVEEARIAAGIGSVILPPHLYSDAEVGRIDKWGNPILPDGRRLRGELFEDASVQKVLREGGALPLFDARVRYPRTYHVPFSPSVGKDDRILESYAAFEGRRIIVTRKFDGESTTVYPDGYVHARSLETESHPSRDRVRALAAAFGPELPTGWRLCGENVYAKHAIHYQHLPAHFLVISIWDEHNVCLPWDETVEWARLLGLETVTVLYDGPFDEDVLRSLDSTHDASGDEAEGWVMRVADAFPYGAFRTHVAKFVRSGHVLAGSHHWKRAQVVPNVVEPR